MGLWILRAREDLSEGDDPWEPWYDKCFGQVVRAETEMEARQLAHKGAGDENRGEYLHGKIANTTSPWLHSKYSTCEVLPSEGLSEIILQDVSRA